MPGKNCALSMCMLHETRECVIGKDNDDVKPNTPPLKNEAYIILLYYV